MTKEELIKEAKLKYPVGSKFRDLVHGEVFTVSSHYFDSFGDNRQLYIPVEKREGIKNKSARVYQGGKWAERVDDEEPNQDTIRGMLGIQEMCKNKFPIGCTYVSMSDDKEQQLRLDTFTYRIQSGSIYAHGGGGYLYKNGKFAQRVEVENKSDIKIIQEECKRRFPIGCTYIEHGNTMERILKQDDITYKIHGDYIYAHSNGGCLYNGAYAERVDGEEVKKDTRPQIEIIQEECKMIFPIGCEYISVGSAAARILQSDTHTYALESFKAKPPSILAHSGGGYLYKDGEFAAIVTQAPQASVDMNEVQSECMRRFPIGCIYIEDGYTMKRVLKQDDATYKILNSSIYAHEGGGLLYSNGVYSKMIVDDAYSVQIEMEYVQDECKRRFPIGCTYAEVDALSRGSIDKRILRQDYNTYRIHNGEIYAHDGGGLLYVDGIYAQKLDVAIVTPNSPLKYQNQVINGNDISDYQVFSSKDIPFDSSTIIHLGSGVFKEPEGKYIEEIAFKRIGEELEHTEVIPKLIEEIPFRRI